MHRQTCVVTLQNGIDAKSVIGQYVDPNKIAQGVIYLAAYIKDPGQIMTPGGKHLMLVASAWLALAPYRDGPAKTLP